MQSSRCKPIPLLSVIENLGSGSNIAIGFWADTATFKSIGIKKYLNQS